MTDTDIQASIRRAAWPEPSPALRTRVLQDNPLVERGLAWTDRIWFSRGWRVSLAAAATGAILPGSMSSPMTLDDGPTTSEMARVAAIEEIMRDARLPPDDAAMFARRAVDVRPPTWSTYRATSLRLEGLDAIGGRR